MGNVVWLIIMLAVGMWILSNLFRGGRNEREQQQRPRPRDNPPRRERPTVTDIDRFLEEINRRKNRPQEKPRAATVETSRAQAERQRRLKTARGEVVPRSRAIPTVVPEPRAEVIPVLEAVPVVQVVRNESSMEANKQIESARASARPTVTSTKAAPVVNLVLPFLRSPQSLQTAFVLHEVLGPPRCRRILPKP